MNNGTCINEGLNNYWCDCTSSWYGTHYEGKIRVHTIMSVFSHFNLYWSLADPGGCCQCAPPTGSNSFIFTYVFTKKHPHRRSVPPQQLNTPPMGNPGSTTVSGGIIGFSDYMQINSFNDFHTLNLETQKFRIKPGTNRNVMSSLVRMKMRSYHIWLSGLSSC